MHVHFLVVQRKAGCDTKRLRGTSCADADSHLGQRCASITVDLCNQHSRREGTPTFRSVSVVMSTDRDEVLTGREPGTGKTEIDERAQIASITAPTATPVMLPSLSAGPAEGATRGLVPGCGAAAGFGKRPLVPGPDSGRGATGVGKSLKRRLGRHFISGTGGRCGSGIQAASVWFVKLTRL